MKRLLLCLACVACNEDLGIGADVEFAGTYDASGTWNLAGPFAGERSVGDAVAEGLIEQIIDALGVPSLLHDRAYDTLASLFAADVAALVDAAAPTELAPTSPLVRALSASLADIDVESTITLDHGTIPGSLEGTETIVALAYTHDSTVYRLAASDLAPGTSIAADWSGRASGLELSVDQHTFALRFGELVRRIAERVVDLTGQQEIASDAAAAVDCGNVVAVILDGDASLSLDVDGFSGSLSASELDGLCGTVRTFTGNRVLGLFEVGDVVEVGGIVRLEAHGDVAHGLTSDAGYGGTLNVAPGPVAPRVSVQFAATAVP
jgi:hypothetical protein